MSVGMESMRTPLRHAWRGLRQLSIIAWGALLTLILVPPVIAQGENIMKQSSKRPPDPNQVLERTSFQTGSPWDPMLDLRSDVVMCYGVLPTNVKNIAKWKEEGYIVQVMTGVAWGSYQDYLYGRFDGVNHVDEAQTDKNGNVISHGGDIYYMCPGINYGKFLCVGVKRALDSGAEAIHLEEPEFWVRAGWSEGFKREWNAYYHEDWVPPDSSPEAQYKASLLKYYLYRRALKQIFDFIKEYNKEHGEHVKCYVATHSLINYSSWGIVSPESSLMKVGADGYIAQIWTGTARTPNLYEGVQKERTFETAFLEYGAMMNIVQSTGGRVWFLNDPVEDDPNHSWRDYKTNWESTLTASLLWPQVWRYEVMPWPERVFHGTYPTKDVTERKAGEPVTKEPIPPDYATELMTVINALNHMKQSEVQWKCGTRSIGVVVSDTMMFERYGPSASDPHLGSFFGLALPPLMHGMPVEPVQLENASIKGFLKPYKILLMTYEGMKPMEREYSAAIADWVKQGGVLVFVDDDSDPFNTIKAWWNEGSNACVNPREALFEQMGMAKNAKPGAHKVGKGWLIYDQSSPAKLTYQANGANHVRVLIHMACEKAHLPYHTTNYVILRRGPYVIASGLDQSLPQSPYILHGHFIDLFDANLPILSSVALNPGKRFLLLDLDYHKSDSPEILAAACKTLGARRLPNGGFRFYAEGPDNITATIRMRFDREPQKVQLDGKDIPVEDWKWDKDSKTLWMRFPNSADGHWITIR